MFYNVENLFDCKDDSLKADEEFLPEGNKHWASNRFYQKIRGVSKTILAINQWQTPSIIGLCEVENEWTLKQLVYNTGLNNLGYKYIHFESSDKRGIDVALLYKNKEFNLLHSSPIFLSDTSDNFYTRDALYVKGIIASDTIHLIVNHWPSKRGGIMASEMKRQRVSNIIATTTDSIAKAEFNPRLVVMGDFNAELTSPSIKYLLTEAGINSQLNPKDISSKLIKGSYKYQGQWSLIDHIFLSKHWLDDEQYSFKHEISNLPYLFEKDETNSGIKPHRTYAGPRYIGGISDHLPVIINISK
ncbi:endonuclease/exonuclease/phosphatase family protein [Carboxylicivirga marina]|uniref:endonuclease/exonuclease/phosphatase family protein n=1 Tax=Carboxylicivirga marina TaxID=2800988 RepID=UPI002592803C|nr:endonuclease/exonuclease/phosphatase family protein [uncultured Carboxylicivirga sp.]